MTQPRALICGVSGQDGAYLAQHLLGEGYDVHGTSRDAAMASLGNLERLGIRADVHVRSMAVNDFRSVLQTLLEVEPTEIYNLAGQSSVGLSFDQPVETLESLALGTLNLLEALRLLKSPARFYNACSGECFGEQPKGFADEATPFRPRSPYGVAKATSFWTTVNYREAYGLYACSGILFNHESPLRPARFVTRKITQGALRIAEGRADTLALGNLDVERDWGWAPEYVVGMAGMLRLPAPVDLVLATGTTASLREFVAAAFDVFGLDWQDHVVLEPGLLRPSDIQRSAGCADRARDVLGWHAATRMPDVVRRMAEAERDAPPRAAPDARA
jgi:GDPmannose 4,6-dehydratase